MGGARSGMCALSNAGCALGTGPGYLRWLPTVASPQPASPSRLMPVNTVSSRILTGRQLLSIAATT
eukprot:scaffold24272_cov27-Tisochrysis_lutea.AAC.2